MSLSTRSTPTTGKILPIFARDAIGMPGQSRRFTTFMCDSVTSTLGKCPELFWAGIERIEAMDITGEPHQHHISKRYVLKAEWLSMVSMERS